MSQPAVELDHGAPGDVLHVAVGDGSARSDPPLPFRGRQAVRPLDAGEITMFEHGVHALGHVLQHLEQETAPRKARAGTECSEQAGGSRASALARIPEHGNGVGVPWRRGGDIEQRMLQADACGRAVCLHARPQVGDPVQLGSGTLHDAACPVHRDVDGSVRITVPVDPRGPASRNLGGLPVSPGAPRRPKSIRAQGRLVAQRRGPVAEQCSPGPLDPGEGARVVDEDTRIHPGPLTPTKLLLNQGVVSAVGQHLSARDQPGLCLQ